METELTLVFPNKNFDLPAPAIALIYRHRRQIELSFKWPKQHLRLGGFFSNTFNGAAVQIRTALSA
jgi:IS4 transposase